ncbi:sugar ABC transporter ATP-binding protein [Actinomadura litoris]|uniref:ATP-binding cassette domain-containing protein n=1 Tax=Actinomadura litoris TaxID=2678616 RepID=A0A7K1L5G7_9ACTN|nr:sugar ABC transporter ATP-binding protein [Actinomadura litoris]MUN39496.1 ATP-binding cassette domain-containing protein [Actinomadura litoris]
MDVALDRIGKSYGGTAVLREVTLDLPGGRVHGVVGENGAGKSTLARVLCGAVRPDSGRVTVDGAPVRLRAPRDALRHGIALVTQEGAIVPGLSVLDNVFLGTPHATRRRERFAALLDRTGFDLPAAARAGDLPLVQRQRTEILRALAHGARLLVLDEPTALLPRTDAALLLALARRLAADGTGIVLISHRLEEVLDGCDTVTVLRDGRHVSTAPAADRTAGGLLEEIAGRPVETRYPEPEPVPAGSPVLLEARELSRGDAVRGVSLRVRAGEIVGLAGLVGSGRTETLRLLFGADRRDSGEVRVAGRPLRARGGPAAAIALGMALVPESRAEHGLVLVRPTTENLRMTALPGRRPLRVVRRGAERRAAQATADGLGVRGTGLDRPAWTLSGGNQQRAVFGKWLVRRPRVLLADEPTRGVDVAAKAQIHRLVTDLAARGTAVLVASSEVEEVLGLAHRVLVMRGGAIAGECPRGAARAGDVLALAGLR